MISSSILGTQGVHSIDATLAQTDFLGDGYVFGTLMRNQYPNSIKIELLPSPQLTQALPSLATILQACVADGASVGFLLPFPLESALAYWQKLRPALAANEIKILIARLNGETVGTVQLHLATPANGRHRAEVAKLLVHPKARRQGIASQLMQAVEALAKAEHRTLLVLDTSTADHAERLYQSLGWQTAGIIPEYALSTAGSLCPTTLMFKILA